MGGFFSALYVALAFEEPKPERASSPSLRLVERTPKGSKRLLSRGTP